MPKKKKDVIGNNDSKEVKDNSNNKKFKNNRKNYIVLLSLLLIMIIMWDIIFVYAYYKPDFSGFKSFFSFKSGRAVSENTCSDGTPLNKCSDDKPFFCYNKELVRKASVCGCPKGSKLDFQDCVKV